MKEKKASVSVRIAEKVITKIADLYSGFICQGRWYEPKMPEKLKK